MLPSLHEIKLTFQSITSIKKGGRPFFLVLITYAGLCAIVFGAFNYFLISNQESLKLLIMDYLLPRNWHAISEKLFHFFFESQSKIVITNMVLSGSLIISSVLLFPLKEHCSALFEKCLTPNMPVIPEFPLWLQALEEGKLLLIYITSQSVIFAIGYYPYDWSTWLSNSLSILFLCFTFGLDFIAPTLQRHHIKYNVIIRFLTQRWLGTFVFGALFSLPIMLVGQAILNSANLPLTTVTALLFAINLFVITLAIPSGTFVAVHYRTRFTLPQSFSSGARKVFYSVALITLAISSTFHVLVARSMHHKSQLLKCYYNVRWSTLQFNFPNITQLLNGNENAHLAFDLEINNPTPFDVVVEDSLLTVWRHGRIISQTHITSFSVGSGETKSQSMQLESKLALQGISELKNLTAGWRIQLEFQLMPGIPFVVDVYKDARSP